MIVVALAYVAVNTIRKSQSVNVKSEQLQKVVFLICTAFFCAVLTVHFMEKYVIYGLIIHEASRMMFCVILMLTVNKVYINFSTVYFCSIIALLPNFIIQVFQYLQNGAVTAFIQKHYVLTEGKWSHLQLAEEVGTEFRAGSIFINPNVYMVIPLIVLCVLLQKDRQKPTLLNNILILCAVLSGALTGSRTATVVMIIAIAGYYLKYASAKSRSYFAIITVLGVIFYGENLLMESRCAQLGGEDMGSLEYKIMSYIYYWLFTSDRMIYWFTGSLGAPILFGLDSEWGHIYLWYGLLGLCWYISYYKILWNKNPQMQYYSKIITIACILVSFTASILLCMPVYSFVAAIAFSNVFFETTQQDRVL